MAGYDDTRQMIISAIMGRPDGTEIQDTEHQAYELNMLDYIRSIEMSTTSTLIGIAEGDTVPVQPDNANVCYIAGISQGSTVIFQNFIDYSGEPISITTGEMQAYFVILLWNKQYWSMQSLPTSIISHAENANFFYSYNIRKTYDSFSAMENDNDNPVGIDGRFIKIGEIVSVVNNSDKTKNGFYSYTGSGWQFQNSFNLQVSNDFGTDVNSGISQYFFTKEVHGKTILSINISQIDNIGVQSVSNDNVFYKVLSGNEENSMHGLLYVIYDNTNKICTQRYYTHYLLNNNGIGFSNIDINSTYVYERFYYRDTGHWTNWQNTISNDFGSSINKPVSQKLFTDKTKGITGGNIDITDTSSLDAYENVSDNGLYALKKGENLAGILLVNAGLDTTSVYQFCFGGFKVVNGKLNAGDKGIIAYRIKPYSGIWGGWHLLQEDLDADISSLRTICRNLSYKIDDTKAELEGKIDDVEESLSRIIAILESKVDDTKIELESKIKKVSNDVDKLDGEFSDFKSLFKVMSEQEYNDIVSSGSLDENSFYFLYEEE